jgi:hypothetical protein
MKTFSNFIFLFTAFILSSFFVEAQVTVVSGPNGSWSVPTNVTNFKVELWGGGGGGGNSSETAKASAGGGGGAYGRKTFMVTPNKTTPEVSGVTLAIGAGGASNANGGASTFSFNGSSILTANGGLAGSGVTAGLAVNATASGTSFDQVYSGGRGGAGLNEDRGGAGGGGAGAAAGAGLAGAAANNGQQGSAGGNNGDGISSGGQGGDRQSGGSNNPIGRIGLSPGGGGGGAGGVGGSFSGGAGANGQINISYLQIDYYFYSGNSDRLIPSLAAGASGTALNGRNINITGQSASYFDSLVSGVSTRFFLFVVRPGTAGVLSAPTVTTVGGSPITATFKSVSNNNTRYQIIIPKSQLPVGVSQLVVSFTASGLTNIRTLEIDQSALPVMFGKFIAQPGLNNSVKLNWSTSSEIVNKGFSIERQTSNANGKFESIGFVASKAPGGNSQTPLYYSFTDEMPSASATNFYRLAQQDLDGKISYSEVRSLKLGKETVTMVSPNPSNGAVSINRTADGKKMNIQVVDQSGKIIRQVNNIADANYKLNIQKSGVYTIKMTYPETGEQSIQRVVVQK